MLPYLGRLIVSSPSRRVIKYRVDDHNDDIGEEIDHLKHKPHYIISMLDNLPSLE